MPVPRVQFRLFCRAARVALFLLLVSVTALRAVAAGSEPPAPPAAVPDFQLNELRVLGNTVLTPLQISSLLYQYLGPHRTLADVERARTALEAEYHAAGYGTVFVDIPEQTVGDDGVVRLHVTESKLQHAGLSGARYFSNRQIRAAVPAAAAGTVPNLPAIQAQVNAVNAVTADRVVVPVLKAGSTPGTVVLDMKVQDHLPLHGLVELNNQYAADTSQLRSILALSYDNAFGRQDSLGLQLQTSPQQRRQVDVLAATYSMRLNDSANRLTFTFIDSSSEVATLSDINVIGKGRDYGLKLLHPAPVDGGASLSVGLEYKDSAQDVSLSANQSLSTPLSYASLQFGFGWQERNERGNWLWTNAIVLGLPGVGGSRSEFADKCFGCKPGFWLLRSDASIERTLLHRLSAALRVAGQYSVDPVISNEQLLLGGAHSVRGYLEAEEPGDAGVRAALELHVHPLVPEAWRVALDPFLFFDTGFSSFQQPLPGQTRRATLRSAGVGLNWAVWHWLSGSLTLAQPLIDATRTRHGDRRLEFDVRGTF